MKKHLPKYFFLMMLTIGTLFSDFSAYGQTVLEAEDAGWIESFGVYTGTWGARSKTYNSINYSGRKANTSGANVRARYILASTVFGGGFTGDTYNIDVQWIDETTSSSDTKFWFQIGRRDAGCNGTATTVCTSGTFPVLADWIADATAAGPVVFSYSGVTISPSDTIFMYTVPGGNTNNGWFDKVIFTSIATGIKDAEFNSEVKLFPNPTKSTLNIESEKMNLSGAKIKILNSYGVRVLEEDYNGVLSMEGLKSGIYSVIITHQGKTAIQKLVIE